MEQEFGELHVFPRELKFLILTHLDAQSVGRLMQVSKSFNNLPSEAGFWKYYCLKQWNLSPEKFKKIDSIATNINWKREYKVLNYFYNRIFHNKLAIRSEDSALVKPIDADENSLHFVAPTDSINTRIEAVAVQGKYKLYPLPMVNFAVGYYEVTVEEFGKDSEPVIGIGLALKKYARAMPGWGKDSYGLHADDGCFFSQRPFGLNFSEIWQVGDTIGLGINFAKKELFITRNGVMLGSPAKRVRNLLHMHPTVGIRTLDNKCRVNFGQRPFEFDILNYLRELEKDEEVNTKWPFKLYSQIIQEFEEQLVDDEDPEEVERELMGAMDYYEKEHEEKAEEPKEPKEGHEEPHEHVEGEEHDAEEAAEKVRDPSERLKEFMEWLFGKIEVLETENTRQAVAENRPEMKNVLTRVINDLQLPIDTNQPLPQMLNLVRNNLLLLLASQYNSYLLKEREKRKSAEEKDPSLKKRTMEEQNQLYDSNSAIFIADRDFPDDHPLIKRHVQNLARQHRLDFPDPENPTWQDRVDLALLVSYRLFYRHRYARAVKEKAVRRKDFEEERDKKRAEFHTIFGADSYLDSTEQTLESEGNETSSKSDTSLDDIWAARQYCGAKYYGGVLRNPRFGNQDREVLEVLLWWYLSAEEPLDPQSPIEEYKAHCRKVAEERVDYWEDDQQRYESIMRGTLALLKDPEFDPDDPLLIVITVGWSDYALPLIEANPEISNEQLRKQLIEEFEGLLKDLTYTYPFLKQAKETARARAQQAARAAEEAAKNPKKPEPQANGTENDVKSWKPLLTAASIIASAALIGGAVFLFRKKLFK
eukprot:TRINITY_DN618_c0_g1_i2.p1 TRINITY_DN618_c0_g1~~TRINITY_DN618_c0_g1_i2.p1  ORF type:complete len:817 (-),score=281.09 TRINITY_DN618_c0_g1_i2:32-2482(-)